MTCKINRDDHGELKSMTFHCDAEGCATEAGDIDIDQYGSLRGMGWWAAGGRHYCPEHFDQGGELGEWAGRIQRGQRDAGSVRRAD